MEHAATEGVERRFAQVHQAGVVGVPGMRDGHVTDGVSISVAGQSSSHMRTLLRKSITGKASVLKRVVQSSDPDLESQTKHNRQ